MNQANLNQAVASFRDAISFRLGLMIEDTKLEELEHILHQRLAALAIDLETYISQLREGDARAELDILAPLLTIGETYFFRHAEQFEVLRDAAIPELIQGGATSLRLLSAGCASGEEPYTMAILFRDSLAYRDVPVTITGLDINPVALRKAKEGRFPRWSLRETPKQTIDQWFTQQGSAFTLDTGIRNSVQLHAYNLAGVSAPPVPRPCHVIFCRNVLMYFSPEAGRRLVNRLADALIPGGFLFLGHAETLRGVSDDFDLCQARGTFYYRRRTSARTIALCSPPSESKPARLLAHDPAWVDRIDEATQRVFRLSERRRPAASSPARSGKDGLQLPFELLGNERFAAALTALRSLPAHQTRDPDALILEAALLVHAGNLTQAHHACTELLRRDSLNAGAHYLLAICFEAEGDTARAIHHDESAIYLDPTFAMPQLHLALLERRLGNPEDARRRFATAHSLLQREDSARLVLYGAGFGRQALLTLCSTEMGGVQ